MTQTLLKPDLNQTWTVGDVVADQTHPPISRYTLALYAGASGDHNDVHVDIDAAKAAGLPDVIGHGMLTMAYLARAVTTAVPQRRLRRWGVRFAAPTRIGEVLRCSAAVAELVEIDGLPAARLDLKTINRAGEIKLFGEAIVLLADPA
ncbi:MAG: acyl dehydratase MaoC [Caulobacter sp.]|nr:acyl dehydratase MaoC [Caulobacter sp.]